MKQLIWPLCFKKPLEQIFQSRHFFCDIKTMFTSKKLQLSPRFPSKHRSEASNVILSENDERVSNHLTRAQFLITQYGVMKTSNSSWPPAWHQMTLFFSWWVVHFAKDHLLFPSWDGDEVPPNFDPDTNVERFVFFCGMKSWKGFRCVSFFHLVWQKKMKWTTQITKHDLYTYIYTASFERHSIFAAMTNLEKSIEDDKVTFVHVKSGGSFFFAKAKEGRTKAHQTSRELTWQWEMHPFPIGSIHLHSWLNFPVSYVGLPKGKVICYFLQWTPPVFLDVF